jgi:hypothetical protein
MKKNFKILITLICFVGLSVILAGIYKCNFTNDDIYLASGGKINSKDDTYTIDGKIIKLKNGTFSDPTSKTIIRYFGNDVIADLNGDGKNDSAFLLTEETGGSGTFFYVAAQITNGNNYIGTNAVFLGDRIAPQTTEYRGGLIIVNFADRMQGESFTTPPSFGISRYFKIINNTLTEVAK